MRIPSFTFSGNSTFSSKTVQTRQNQSISNAQLNHQVPDTATLHFAGGYKESRDKQIQQCLAIGISQEEIDDCLRRAAALDVVKNAPAPNKTNTKYREHKKLLETAYYEAQRNGYTTFEIEKLKREHPGLSPEQYVADAKAFLKSRRPIKDE